MSGWLKRQLRGHRAWQSLGAAAVLCSLAVGARAQGVPASGSAASGTSMGQSTVPQAATSVGPGAGQVAGAPEPTVAPLTANLTQYSGQTVTAIQYEGVDFDKTDKLSAELTQKQGEPLDPVKVRQTTRRLFATGRYRNIAVRVDKTGDGVTLIFVGVPRYYVGRVQIDGVKTDRLASLLEYGTKLSPGAPFTNADVTAGTESVKQVLAQNGYYQPTISVKTTRDDEGQQVNVTYTIATGPQARVGTVTLEGKNPGISVSDFRKKGKLTTRILHRSPKVTRETTSTALTNMRTYFQKKDRLEATVTLQKSTYDATAKALDYDFQVDQGPTVKVLVNGAKLSKSRLHLLVPIYEEGTIDTDLLNEGTFNLKDYLQQQGYFEAKVTVDDTDPAPDKSVVIFNVDKGNKHRVDAVDIVGNKYFATDLLKEGLKVQKADAYLRSGRFSQALVTADQNAMGALYRANGFKDAKVTSKVLDSGTKAPGEKAKLERIRVEFTVVEGTQEKFGDVALNGVDPSRKNALAGLLNAAGGQPFSLITLSGDRDTILGYYLSNGFDQAKVEVAQTPNEQDKTKNDIGFNVTEGKQVFIGKVLESGIHYTRPKVVNQELRVHAGDPLDQSALLETQRNLYDLALFNEVNAAVQNPAGDAELKNVLVQVTEARRWDVTYGFGFEVQTGTPACQYCTQQGTTKAQQGKAGISPRVSLDVGRINLRGKDNSLTLHTTYGLLERIATLTFQNPHLLQSKKLSAQVSAGYSNVQDISTFASSKLQGDFRVTQKVGRKDTFIYDFEFRRVAVDPNSLAIAPNLIPILSQPVRVGGPAITWFHDTRTPSPLDAYKGSYLSVQNFFASSIFGSQTSFNRTDITNSTYYQFGKRKYVFARSTRLGFIASFGTNPNIPTTGSVDQQPCGRPYIDTNASCSPVPLPERLYAGGATSHRGFPINGAGPRDLQTGYPVGGSAALLNTFEMRLPAPTLPYVGDSVSFVIFHDMGNVFQHVGDMFPSIGHFKQPDQQTCRVISGTIGTCNFNYFSHALGLGARYKTPVGPIRVDLSYNLNPPVYPIIPAQITPGVYPNGQQPSVGMGNHLNFFFSIGQSF